MSSFSKVKLSGSTDGKAIVVAASSTPGTTIHTAHASSLDEIWLWCQNTGTADVKLTLEWGAATAPDNNIEITIPGESGLVQVSPGLLLTNSLVVKAFGGTASVLTIYGFVNRIT